MKHEVKFRGMFTTFIVSYDGIYSTQLRIEREIRVLI